MPPVTCWASTSACRPLRSGMETPPAPAADYFDGMHAGARPVTLHMEGGDLLLRGEGFEHRVPAAELDWPEPTRHGMRVLHLARGGSVQCTDSAAWDAWCRANGRGPGWVARLQGSWRWVLASVAVLLALAVALQRWGLPVLADAVVAATPAQVESALGASALATVDRFMLQPSQLAPARQSDLRAAFARVVAAQPPGTVPPWQLVFRASRIGPNAFALPGGTIVLTDELVTLFADDEAVLMGVLAHELGHVRHRHGLRLLVQGTVLAAVAAVVFGDFSSLLASAPVALGNAGYSRAAEREADRVSAQMLAAAGISPQVMVQFFEVIGRERGTPPAAEADRAWSGIAIASHPADADRIRFFREAARH